MKKAAKRTLMTLALVPCAIVNGFQQVTHVPVRRQRLDVGVQHPLQSTLMEEAAETTSSTSSSSSLTEETSIELPTVLQSFVDERAEFRIALGKAMDTLRRDYPNVIFKEPDFSIYHDQINVVDPSGVQFTGIKNYRASFAFFQSFTKLLYCDKQSTIQMRMVPDPVLSSIRISWNAKLVPRLLPMGKPLYVDGVSIYHLDTTTRKIDEHRIEQLYINRKPVMPPYGILSLLMQEEMAKQKAVRVPVGVW